MYESVAPMASRDIMWGGREGGGVQPSIFLTFNIISLVLLHILSLIWATLDKYNLVYTCGKLQKSIGRDGPFFIFHSKSQNIELWDKNFYGDI